jgi:hypothetical protein
MRIKLEKIGFCVKGIPPSVANGKAVADEEAA